MGKDPPDGRSIPIAERGINTRWKPGQSGNPGGAPRNAVFRSKCRKLAERLLERLDLEEPADAAALIKVFAEVANRGGYLDVGVSMRLLLDAMSSKELTAEQRTSLMQSFSEGEAEPAALDDVKPETT